MSWVRIPSLAPFFKVLLQHSAKSTGAGPIMCVVGALPFALARTRTLTSRGPRRRLSLSRIAFRARIRRQGGALGAVEILGNNQEHFGKIDVDGRANIRKGATVGAILLWLLGVPIPIIIILLLLWH